MCQWPSMPPMMILGYSDCPRNLSALRIQLQHSFQSIYFVKNVTFQASFASKSQLWPISIVGNRFWLTEMKIFSKLENSWLLKISSMKFSTKFSKFSSKNFSAFSKKNSLMSESFQSVSREFWQESQESFKFLAPVLNVIKILKGKSGSQNSCQNFKSQKKCSETDLFPQL